MDKQSMHRGRRETLNDRSVFVWLTIVMGRWIRHGACTLWHDGVLWKIMQCGIRCIFAKHRCKHSVLQNHLLHFYSMFSVFFSRFCTCVASSMDCPLTVGNILVELGVSVQSASEDGFHLLPLRRLILWAQMASSLSEHKYTPRYIYCADAVDFQGVDLPLPWCWASGQICAAPAGVSLPSPGGKHAAASPSAPAEDIH